jgi:hypothetical protein
MLSKNEVEMLFEGLGYNSSMPSQLFRNATYDDDVDCSDYHIQVFLFLFCFSLLLFFFLRIFL